MVDIVFNCIDKDTLLAEAKRIGFCDEEGNILIAGTFSSGGGWMLNIVGKTTQNGYWGRLRVNGSLDNLPSFNSNIVQYVWNEYLNGWTEDGVNLAPDWVDSIGAMA